jgi:LmbE family N-acetylglucosaminyl deacetylase
MEIRNKNILVVCAHLDDETYGLGGTLLKLANPELNNKIRIITFCSGLDKPDEDRIIRYYNNLDNIGVDGIIIGYNDVTLDTVSILELSQELNETIATIMPEPNIIFTHTVNDTHKDHKILSELVDVYCRSKNISIFHFYTGGNSDWSSNSIKPNLFIDISDYKKDKKKLINNYKKYPKNNPLNYKKIKAKDSYYGSLVGVKAAEIFEIKRLNIV